MKGAIIIHCWEGYPEHCWYQWAKDEPESKGFEVQAPAMPDTENPRQDAWVSVLAGKLG